MRKLVLIAIFVFVFVSLATAQNSGAVNPDVQKQIGASLTIYYALKDAFIDSDGEKAGVKAEELAKTFDAIEVGKMTDAQKTTWGKLEKLLLLDAKQIKDSKDLELQRGHFAKLSNSMYALVFNFKANETEAYLFYCPMKKATWLSDSKEIRNPFMGKQMLDCGSVRATLKKN